MSVILSSAFCKDQYPANHGGDFINTLNIPINIDGANEKWAVTATDLIYVPNAWANIRPPFNKISIEFTNWTKKSLDLKALRYFHSNFFYKTGAPTLVDLSSENFDINYFFFHMGKNEFDRLKKLGKYNRATSGSHTKPGEDLFGYEAIRKDIHCFYRVFVVVDVHVSSGVYKEQVNHLYQGAKAKVGEVEYTVMYFDSQSIPDEKYFGRKPQLVTPYEEILYTQAHLPHAYFRINDSYDKYMEDAKKKFDLIGGNTHAKSTLFVLNRYEEFCLRIIKVSTPFKYQETKFITPGKYVHFHEFKSEFDRLVNKSIEEIFNLQEGYLSYKYPTMANNKWVSIEHIKADKHLLNVVDAGKWHVNALNTITEMTGYVVPLGPAEALLRPFVWYPPLIDDLPGVKEAQMLENSNYKQVVLQYEPEFVVSSGLVIKFHPLLCTLLGINKFSHLIENGMVRQSEWLQSQDIIQRYVLEGKKFWFLLDFNRVPIPALWVFCDIIESSYVAGSMAQLLRVIPLDLTTQRVIYSSFNFFTYKPINKNCIKAIRITVRDGPFGEIIPFHRDIYIKLEFKRLDG